ncbi:MAG: DUF11 domain-containing protein, partial [Anaerolineae bacterium]|nr:DUF11 domain-containing protein [Anaerolineae bacterium]
TILNNSVNETHALTPIFGALTETRRASQLTTVRGERNLTITKVDFPDPVGSGSTLSYQILLNNTGDDTAFNVTVIEIYPFNVTFNGSSPAPSAGNNTFSLGNLEPNQTTTVNITVNVSPAMTAGTLNNTAFANASNLIGVNQTVNASTLTSIAEFIPPNVTDVTPIAASSFLLNDTVFISANVTDNVAVDAVYVALSYPNGSNTTMNLSLIAGNTYGVNFSNLTQRGQYDIIFVANDTSNNINNSAATNFFRQSLDIIDIVNQSQQFLNYSVAVMSNDSGVLNLSVNISGKRIKEMNISLHDETAINSILMIDDETPMNATPFFAEYAIDGSGLNFTNATAVVTAVGDSVLYTCKNYNFSSQDCIDGNWSALMNITAGQNYTLFLTPIDPAFLETSAAVDVAMAPINLTSFVIAFADNATGTIGFRVMNTNGSVIVNTTTVDSPADNTSRVDVAMLNSTEFALTWAKGPSGNVSLKLFQLNGSNTSNQVNLGSVGVNKDIAVATINGRFTVCYANDTNNDAEFRIFFNNLTNATGTISVDADMTPSLPLQNLVDCTGVNSTRWEYNWFDDGANDVSFDIRNQAGGSLTGEVDLDAAVGETAQVATTALDNDKMAFVFYDSADEDITIAIRTVNNTVILAPSDIDTAAGTISRVAAGTVRLNDTATNDSFVIAWWDSASSDIKAAVINSTGGNVTAPFTVEAQPNAT